MTSVVPHPALGSPSRARARRAGALLRALAGAAVAGAVAVWLAALPEPPAGSRRDRVALVVDAGARPQDALARARAWAVRIRGRDRVDVAVRVPRTAAEAATDVRYLAAAGYGTVVAVGPHAGAAAARAVTERDLARTRFVARPTPGL